MATFELLIILSYVGIGAFAGLLAGLLGVGGGLIIVPLLSLLYVKLGFPADTLLQCAVATSLSTIIVTSMVSFYHHHKHRAVMVAVFWQLTVGTAIGAVIGAWIASRVQSDVLKNIFGIFELIVGLHLLGVFRLKRTNISPGALGNSVAGVGVGGVSALLGIGGGTMTVPYLVACGHTIHKSVGTSAALGLPLAIAGTMSFIGLTENSTMLPPYNLGYVHIPAFIGISVASSVMTPLGVRMAHRTSTSKLKLIFGLFLLVLGILMLLN
jgi:hypothetical protein